MVDQLIKAATDVGPWFLALLLIGLFLVYVVEKLGGKDGPITRVLTWISNRELNALRKQGELEAERQRIASLQESRAVQRVRRRLAEAYDEIDELEHTVDWMLKDRNDQRRRDRARGQFDAALVEWFQDVIRLVAQKAPGVQLPAPPRPPTGLAELLVLDDDLPDDVRPSRPRPAATRSRREVLEEEWREEDVEEDELRAEERPTSGRRLTDRRA